jgi:hypothetical protein
MCHSRKYRCVLLGAAALGVSLFGFGSEAFAQANAAPIGSVAWYQVGRTGINPATGAGFAYGYYTQVAGLTGPMFSGVPSESTAYFTFRTSVFQLTPVKTDGDINMAIVAPDTFNVYYNANPKRDWSNPDSFTEGVVVATFTRDQFLLLRIWESFGTEYVHLDSSQDFTFNNVTVNVGRSFTAAAITSTYSNAPLAALPGYLGVISFAGHAVVAVGVTPLKPAEYPPAQ